MWLDSWVLRWTLWCCDLTLLATCLSRLLFWQQPDWQPRLQVPLLPSASHPVSVRWIMPRCVMRGLLWVQEEAFAASVSSALHNSTFLGDCTTRAGGPHVCRCNALNLRAYVPCRLHLEVNKQAHSIAAASRGSNALHEASQ